MNEHYVNSKEWSELSKEIHAGLDILIDNLCTLEKLIRKLILPRCVCIPKHRSKVHSWSLPDGREMCGVCYKEIRRQP